jgi:high affinity choline transporter 7
MRAGYKKIWLPTGVFLLLMGAIGLVLSKFSDSGIQWGAYSVISVFYTAMFWVGAYAATRRSASDTGGIMLAGRALPLWIAAGTMGATWVDGGYINGTAEYTATVGLMWVQAPWGYAFSLVLGGLFFARPMRRRRFYTMIDPLEQRFGKRMGALLFLPALFGEIFWTAAILTALGTTFGTVIGMDTVPAIILSALIAITYTALGGLWAVAMTDVLQMILLLAGLFLVVPFALEHVGGLDRAWSDYTLSMGKGASFLPDREFLGPHYWVWWDSALLLMLGGIPWQVYFQRVLASKDEKTAVRLSFLAALICFIAAAPAVLIGIIGHVADWGAVGTTAPPVAPATLPWVIRYLTNPWVAVAGLAAVAAAVMSSVDSSILSAASMAGWNVFRPLFRPKISSSGLSRVIGKMVWIIGIAATLLALKINSVYQLWFLCSDFVYCLLFPALVCALFDPKANFPGALSGFLTAFILRFGGGDPILGIPALIPYPATPDGAVLFPYKTFAMLSGLSAIIIVSRLTQARYPTKPLSTVAE